MEIKSCSSFGISKHRHVARWHGSLKVTASYHSTAPYDWLTQPQPPLHERTQKRRHFGLVSANGASMSCDAFVNLYLAPFRLTFQLLTG
jgi:uncharacterized integral membrane protein